VNEEEQGEVLCFEGLYRVYLAHWNKDTTDIGKVLNIANGLYMIHDHVFSPFDIEMNQPMHISVKNARVINTVRLPHVRV
jgi:hypothetical protein